MKSMTIKGKPSLEQNWALVESFDYFNERLFEKKLPRPMLIFARNKAIVGGYFAADKWVNDEGTEMVHEIALNANTMKEGDMLRFGVVLVHEMVHMEQYLEGKHSRAGYHNKEFVNRCYELGLQCTSENENGTGQRVDSQMIEGGPFAEAMLTFPEDAIFPWIAEMLDADPNDGNGKGKGKDEGDKKGGSKAGKRSKYTCPVCGLNVWAKAGAKLACLECDQVLIEAQGMGDTEEKAA